MDKQKYLPSMMTSPRQQDQGKQSIHKTIPVTFVSAECNICDKNTFKYG